MSFLGEHDKVVYIIVSINIDIVKDIDSGHYVCDVLNYNTETWLNFDDDTITNYSRYPDNIYDYLSNENEPKKGGGGLLWMDRIILCQSYT